LKDRELETDRQTKRQKDRQEGRELETNRHIFSYKETRTHSVREKYIKGEMEIKRHRVRKTKANTNSD